MEQIKQSIRERIQEFSEKKKKAKTVKDLELEMDRARRKLDQIRMGIETEFDAAHFEKMYFDALNNLREIQGKERRRKI